MDFFYGCFMSICVINDYLSGLAKELFIVVGLLHPCFETKQLWVKVNAYCLNKWRCTLPVIIFFVMSG